MSEDSRREYTRKHEPEPPEAPTHAWLWGNDIFSDITLALRVGDVARVTEAPSSSSLAPALATAGTEQQRKRMRNSACQCPQLSNPPTSVEQQHPGEQPAAGRSTYLQPCLPACPAALRLHRSVLSCTSGFFKRLLTTNMGGWCAECKVATLTMEGCDCEAAHHVLKFMYTHVLPGGSDLDDEANDDHKTHLSDGALLVWMIKVREGIPSSFGTTVHRGGSTKTTVSYCLKARM